MNDIRGFTLNDAVCQTIRVVAVAAAHCGYGHEECLKCSSFGFCLSLTSAGWLLLDRSEGPDEEAATEVLPMATNPTQSSSKINFFLLFCLFCFCCCSQCSASVASAAVRFRLVVFVVVAAGRRCSSVRRRRRHIGLRGNPSIQLVPSSIAVLIWCYWAFVVDSRWPLSPLSV